MAGNSWQRALPSLLLAAVLVAVAAFTLGMPDLAAAGQLLSGAYPSKTAAAALVGAICWLGLGGLVLATVLGATRAVTEVDLIHHRRRRALFSLVAGILLLVMGLIQHGNTYRLCCGSSSVQVQEAEHLAR